MERKASGAFLLAFFLPRYAIDVAMVADDRLVSCVAELFSLLVSGLDALAHKHSLPCNTTTNIPRPTSEERVVMSSVLPVPDLAVFDGSAQVGLLYGADQHVLV